MWPKNINSYILGKNVPTRNEFNSDMTKYHCDADLSFFNQMFSIYTFLRRVRVL